LVWFGEGEWEEGGMRETYISGSLLISAIAAMGIPKLLTGPQKSARKRYVSSLCTNPQRDEINPAILPIPHNLNAYPPSHTTLPSIRTRKNTNIRVEQI
jgi:hypothetical protein